MSDEQRPREPVSSDPLLLTPEEAATVLRLGRTTVYALMKAGELHAVHIGRSRAEFLAGWAAGQAAASACGPLPDEIARDVVLLLDTTTPAPVSPRRPRGGVRDAG